MHLLASNMLRMGLQIMYRHVGELGQRVRVRLFFLTPGRRGLGESEPPPPGSWARCPDRAARESLTKPYCGHHYDNHHHCWVGVICCKGQGLGWLPSVLPSSFWACQKTTFDQFLGFVLSCSGPRGLNQGTSPPEGGRSAISRFPACPKLPAFDQASGRNTYDLQTELKFGSLGIPEH